MNPFKKATREGAKLRLCITGPAGSGKTFTALTLAHHLGEKVALGDSEHGSASKYADLEAHGVKFTFDAAPITKQTPEGYSKVIELAAENGYDVVVLDSITHAYLECLDEVDRLSNSKFKGNSFRAWGAITPRWRALMESILSAPIHVIATMRSKVAYEVVEENGRKVPKKMGLAPIAKEGSDYEFDLVMNMEEGIGHISKSRAPDLFDSTWHKPGRKLAEQIKAWLGDDSNGAGGATAPFLEPAVSPHTLSPPPAKPAPPAPLASPPPPPPASPRPTADRYKAPAKKAPAAGKAMKAFRKAADSLGLGDERVKQLANSMVGMPVGEVDRTLLGSLNELASRRLGTNASPSELWSAVTGGEERPITVGDARRFVVELAEKTEAVK